MFGLFKPKLLVDDDELEWLMACFAWMSEEFGGIERVSHTRLVWPADFPASRAKGHDRALEIFDRVKSLARLDDWPCDLLPSAMTRESRVTTGHGLRHGGQPAMGSFGYDDGRYYIRYNPALLERPQSLVATFAHLLAHYLLHTARTSPPGGSALKKHVCDLAAVRMGFGLFLVNTAKNFEQFQDFGEQGWQSQQSGALSENALLTALALFLRLARADARAAEIELKSYLRGPLRKTLAVLEARYPDMSAGVVEIDLGDWS